MSINLQETIKKVRHNCKMISTIHYKPSQKRTKEGGEN